MDNVRTHEYSWTFVGRGRSTFDDEPRKTLENSEMCLLMHKSLSFRFKMVKEIGF